MRRFPYPDRKEFRIFRRLNTPAKIQDFLNKLRFNFERKGETCRSPLMVLARGEAHCMEGAMLAAAAMWFHGRRPLVLDLKTRRGDLDHVITLFKEESGWGATSKTNHGVLRYRDPIYRTVRELAVSYFNEYFLNDGKKTLRSYSAPFDLSRFGNEWLISEKNLWHIPKALDKSPHLELVSRDIAKRLRLADRIEIKSGKITEHRKS